MAGVLGRFVSKIFPNSGSPNFEPKLRHVLEQLGEVHPGCTQQGIVTVSLWTTKAISFHPMFGFEVPDSRFYGGPAFHPFPEGFGGVASSFFVHMDGDVSSVVVAAVALVGEDVARFGGLVSKVAEQLVHGGGEGVTIVGIAGTGEGGEVPAAFAGGGDADFDSKFVFFVGFAFADAFDLGGVHAVEFLFIVALLVVDALGSF